MGVNCEAKIAIAIFSILRLLSLLLPLDLCHGGRLVLGFSLGWFDILFYVRRDVVKNFLFTFLFSFMVVLSFAFASSVVCRFALVIVLLPLFFVWVECVFVCEYFFRNGEDHFAYETCGVETE